MAWQTNAELPSHVRTVLPEAAQTRFRLTANDALAEGDVEKAAVVKAWSRVKEGWKRPSSGSVPWVRKSEEEINKREMEFDDSAEEIYKKLPKDASVKEWIDDFINSDNPRFEGKSKKERIRMALGAYYSRKSAPDIEKAKPRSLYVSRHVKNADEIIRWAKGQGFKTTMKPSDLHVTIAYSKRPVNWMEMADTYGFASGDNGKDELIVKEGGPRLVEPLGDKGAVVLLFNHDALQWRHRQIEEKGASWDFDGYQPHVTITWDAQDLDLSQVEPYQGKIVFGPEIFKEINDNWSDNITEKYRQDYADIVAKFDPNQERDSHGRWTEMPDTERALAVSEGRRGDGSRPERPETHKPEKAGKWAKDYDDLLTELEDYGFRADAAVSAVDYKDWRDDMEYLDNSKAYRWLRRATTAGAALGGLKAGLAVAALMAVSGVPEVALPAGLAAGVGTHTLLRKLGDKRLKSVADKLLTRRRRELGLPVTKAAGEGKDDLVIRILEGAIKNLDKFEKFDPNQPRDDSGRWSESGGGGGGSFGGSGGKTKRATVLRWTRAAITAGLISAALPAAAHLGTAAVIGGYATLMGTSSLSAGTGIGLATAKAVVGSLAHEMTIRGGFYAAETLVWAALRKITTKLIERREREVNKAKDTDDEILERLYAIRDVLERYEPDESDETEKIDAQVVKVDTSLGLVFGWAIICKNKGEDYYDLNIDKSTGERVPEHITEDAMLDCAVEFMQKYRMAKEMHSGEGVGTVPFAFPLTTEIAKRMGLKTDTTGLMIAMKPSKEVLKKFESGEYTGFSIGGSKVKVEETENA